MSMVRDAAIDRAEPASTGSPGRQVWALAVLTSRANVRQPMVYITMGALPASYFIVISLLAGSDLGMQAFLGAMVSYAVTGGVVSLPQTVVAYRTRRLHEMLVTSPMKPLTYVLGLAVSRILYVAPPLVVVFAIFTVVADVAIWRVLLLVPLVAVAWIIGSVLGFSIAKQWDNPAYISAVANMIGYLLVLLPPVYYPLSILPSEFHTIVLVIPTANIAQLARWITGFADISAMTLAAQGGLLALTVGVLVWFASRDTHWQQV